MNYTKQYGTCLKFAEFLDFVWGKPGWHNLTAATNRLLTESAETATAAGIREMWRQRLPSAQKKRVDLYLAMPYCRQRCAYCMYYSVPLARPADLARYAEKLCASISYYSGVLHRLRFHAVYFGGGTPSLLTKNSLGAWRKVSNAISACAAAARERWSATRPP